MNKIVDNILGNTFAKLYSTRKNKYRNVPHIRGYYCTKCGAAYSEQKAKTGQYSSKCPICNSAKDVVGIDHPSNPGDKTIRY